MVCLLVLCTLLSSHQIAARQASRVQAFQKAEEDYTQGDLKKSRSALLVLDSAWMDEPDSLTAKGYYLLGRIAYSQRKGKEGVGWLQKAVNWYEAHQDDFPLLYLKSCEWLGNIYRYTLRDPIQALPYFEQAREVIERQDLHGTDDERRVTYNLAATYRLLKNTERALVYGNRSLLLARKDTGNAVRLASHLNQMGTLYITAGESETAIAFFESALETLPDESPIRIRRFRYRSNLSDALRESGDVAGSQDMQLINLQEMLAAGDVSAGLLGNTYYILAKNCRLLGKWKSFDEYMSRAVELYQSYYGADHPLVAQLHSYQGLVYAAQPDRALRHLDFALNIYWPSWSEENTMDSWPEEVNWEWLFITLSSKAIALRHRSMEGRQMLDRSLLYHQQALRVYEQSRNTFLEGKSIFGLAEGHFEILEAALETVHLAITNGKTSWSSQQLNQLAWRAIALSKGFLLHQRFTEWRVNQRKILPDTLYDQYQTLRRAYRKYEARSNTDSLYQTQKSLDQWKRTIKTDYPDFLEYLDQTEIIPLGKIMAGLASDEMLLNVFDGESTLFALALSSSGAKLMAIRKDEQWERDLKVYTAFVINQTPETIDVSELPQILASGHAIYSRLLAPVMTPNLHKLIVVSHGQLAHLPVETLLTEPLTSPGFAFQTYPYLVRRVAVQYAFSGAHWYYNTSEINAKRSRESINMSGFAWGNTPRLPAYPALPASTREIEGSTSVWGGEAFVGVRATEANFRRSLTKSDIMHLAVHGDVGGEVRSVPTLIFPEKDEMHDGIFDLNELYGIRLDTRIVVLSSCHTADGDYASGEGVLSMSRGFVFAGCQATLSNLWPSYDRVASSLVDAWHQKVYSGTDLSEALQWSKVDFLQHASPLAAHPSRWAGVILVGDSQISAGQDKQSVINVSIGLLLLMGLFAWFRWPWVQQVNSRDHL